MILLSQDASLLLSHTSAWPWSSTLWMFNTLTIPHKTSLFSYVIVFQNLSEVQKSFSFYRFPSELSQRSLFWPHSPSEITCHLTCSSICSTIIHNHNLLLCSACLGNSIPNSETLCRARKIHRDGRFWPGTFVAIELVALTILGGVLEQCCNLEIYLDLCSLCLIVSLPTQASGWAVIAGPRG